MRIIKKGKIKVKEIVDKCPDCGTEFAYNSDDVKEDREKLYIICPLCDGWVAMP